MTRKTLVGFLWSICLGMVLSCSNGGTNPQEGNGSVDGGPPSDATSAQPDERTAPEKVPLPTQTVFGGNRPVTLLLPKGYDPAEPLPLVMVLHGLGVNGEFQSIYLQLPYLQETKKFLLLAPDGTKFNDSLHFWNIGDKSLVDDVGYLTKLLEDVSKVYRVDSKRVFLVGHSNGGFMSYRMACDVTDKITGIVSFAGTMYTSEEWPCKPSRKVNVLHIHSPDDSVVKYKGGKTNAGGISKEPVPYPGAVETVNWWIKHNQCKELKPTTETLDLEVNVEGNETTVQRAECPEGGAVELWTMDKAKHIPALTEGFSQQIWDWLMKHSGK
ncbi:MAG: hypothetical protein EP343_09475 [Deltaproteobacteria bacterium]|nr:MAG: hypothetical protein EP343_09475 [Deltaproteobacteria bacterium]